MGTVGRRYGHISEKFRMSIVEYPSLHYYFKIQPFGSQNRCLIIDRKVILGYGSHHDTGWCFPRQLISSAHKQRSLAPPMNHYLWELTKSQFATQPLTVRVYCKSFRQSIRLQRWNFSDFSFEPDRTDQHKLLSTSSSTKTLLVP